MIIESPLSVEALKASLEKNADPPPRMSWNPTVLTVPPGLILVQFNGDCFKVRQTNPLQRNDFKPIFYGTVESTEKGSRIVGQFKINLFTRTLMYAARVFTGIVGGLMGLAMLKGYLHHKPLTQNETEFTLGFLGFFIFTFFMPELGSELSPTMVPNITQFLNRCAQKG